MARAVAADTCRTVVVLPILHNQSEAARMGGSTAVQLLVALTEMGLAD